MRWPGPVGSLRGLLRAARLVAYVGISLPAFLIGSVALAVAVYLRCVAELLRSI